MAIDWLLRSLRRRQQVGPHHNRAIVTTIGRNAGRRPVLVHALGCELVHVNYH
jgi:hypothetical protein